MAEWRHGRFIVSTRLSHPWIGWHCQASITPQKIAMPWKWSQSIHICKIESSDTESTSPSSYFAISTNYIFHIWQKIFREIYHLKPNLNTVILWNGALLYPYPIIWNEFSKRFDWWQTGSMVLEQILLNKNSKLAAIHFTLGHVDETIFSCLNRKPLGKSTFWT